MLFLDFLLLLLIVVCIGYCWILSRRIQDLHNSRIEFARMIKELDVSILRAETNINEMAKLSEVTSNEIKLSVAEAHNVAAILKERSENALGVIKKFDSVSLRPYDDLATMPEPVSSLSGKFTDDDFVPVEKDEVVENDSANDHVKHENRMKNFIETIVSRNQKSATDSGSAAVNYYDTLRKIHVKK